MIPTFVFGWPSGQETGDFLAVDLGTFLLFALSFYPNPARPFPPNITRLITNSVPVPTSVNYCGTRC